MLGPYHPVIADNVKRLCEISGLDEVSFHMSGTEAVMQAVRLARYHTRRVASGAVLPAPITAGGATCSPASAIRCRRTKPILWPTCRSGTLHVLRTRRDIACVLVNPLQALHPNANAPGDSALVDSSRKATSTAKPIVFG